MVLMLVTCVIVLVHTKDVTTLEYDDLLPANETNARHRVNTGQSDHLCLFPFISFFSINLIYPRSFANVLSFSAMIY